MKAAKRENLPYLNCKALIPRGEACPCMRERERGRQWNADHNTRLARPTMLAGAYSEGRARALCCVVETCH